MAVFPQSVYYKEPNANAMSKPVVSKRVVNIG